MKLTYLGTAASEGWPALFCNCEYCQKAKKLGGKNIRTRSQALLNDDFLLDFPGDTYLHILKNGLDFSAVKYCFITHSHIDHWMPVDLVFRRESVYAHNMSTPHLDIYGNEKVINRFHQFLSIVGDNYEECPITTHIIKPFETVNAGAYEVIPLIADHSSGEQAFVYLIRQGGKVLLYLHDTGILPQESIDYLVQNRVKADLISYDCTNVILEWAGKGHMGLNNIQELRKVFEQIGISNANTVSVINHFSHNGKLIHEELEPVAAKFGFITAFDGMTVMF